MHEMFKNVQVEFIPFVFLRVELKSEMYLTSSRFSLFKIFCFYANLLLLKIETFYAF